MDEVGVHLELGQLTLGVGGGQLEEHFASIDKLGLLWTFLGGFGLLHLRVVLIGLGSGNSKR